MKNQQEQLFIPTALDQFVSELNHTGKSQYTGMLFPVPTRLSLELYGMVEAMTHHAGTSRNKVMNQLIEVGIQATLQALPDHVVENLHQSCGETMITVCEKNAGLLETGDV